MVDGDGPVAERSGGHRQGQQALGQLGAVLRRALRGTGALAQPVGRRIRALVTVGPALVHQAQEVGIQRFDAGTHPLGDLQLFAQIVAGQRRRICLEECVEFGVDGRQVHAASVSNTCSIHNPNVPVIRGFGPPQALGGAPGPSSWFCSPARPHRTR
ncbi:MAG TPA: hypothetical protein VMW08_03650 [Acidimicrobiales bacterium]|nr:hypothetical protein [Acidimicrobiales bacterium]